MTANAIIANEESYWNCTHSTTAMRWRVMRNGIGIWVLQCLDCGRQVRAIAKGSPEALKQTEQIPFDENLAASLQKQMREANQRHWEAQRIAAAAEAEKQNQDWWDRYNAYLKTPQWQRKRQAVFTRSGGLCEGCRINKAVQVHHLTYDHAFDEFLWELVAICLSCHVRLHPHMEYDL